MAFRQVNDDAGRCRRCAWCTGDSTPKRRGYELTCPHGFGCCQNCATCRDETPR